VPPGHPWIDRRCVTARDFAHQPLILYDRESPITVRTLAFLFDEGVFPRVAVEIDHLEALKDLVRAGVGVGVVPRWSALRELAAGALVAIGFANGRMARTWGLVHVDGHQQSRTTCTFMHLCRDVLPARLASGT